MKVEQVYQEPHEDSMSIVSKHFKSSNVEEFPEKVTVSFHMK